MSGREAGSGWESEFGSEIEPDKDDDEVSFVAAMSEKETLFDPVDRHTASTKLPSHKHVKTSKSTEDYIEIGEKNEVDEEITTEGRVSWEVYSYYLTSTGLGSVFIFGCFILINLSVVIGTQLWLNRWGDRERHLSGTNSYQFHIADHRSMFATCGGLQSPG